jgi:uncharacterized protein YbjT (DUF2867 family)
MSRDGADGARRILVTGATGKQGGAVAAHLLRDQSFRVRAMTRDPSKDAARALAKLGAEVVQGDLDDRASVDRALEGMYGVFSVQNFWETGYHKEVGQGVGLAEAAHEAGVEHFVYSSVGSAHRETGLEHFESKWRIENHVRSLGLPYTIFRPVYFMENWEGMSDYIVAGRLALPLSPETHLQQITVDDVGGFVAMALREPKEWIGKELDLAGDDRPIAETASAFTEVIGRPVQYWQMPWDDFRKAMGEEYYKMMRWFEDVGYEADVPALRKTYPQLTRLETYLKAAGWDAKRPAEAAAL